MKAQVRKTVHARTIGSRFDTPTIQASASTMFGKINTRSSYETETSLSSGSPSSCDEVDAKVSRCVTLDGKVTKQTISLESAAALRQSLESKTKQQSLKTENTRRSRALSEAGSAITGLTFKLIHTFKRSGEFE